MTFAKYIEERLIENGIWPHDAPKIIQMIMDDNEAMKGRWHEDISGYPLMIMITLWMTAKRVALKFIDENQPQAWYRPMFTESQGDLHGTSNALPA